jgi:Fe2+ or Zn2+ uptake regulation protein
VDNRFAIRTDQRPDDDEVCNAVLAYLAEHPHATDTLEGIATWWLPRQQIRFDVERVWRALEALKARGLLEEFRTGDTPWYRLKTADDRSLNEH